MIRFMLIPVILIAGCGADENAKLEYGETGLPKNCRAIIAVNIAAWRNGTYRENEVLESIDRNCGAYGISWRQN